MNNNRGNNRRRGRGNNRAQGGGQQLNRIDSRARGNAPQLLEKYKKLAHDAHLNGDRVQEEYYLQFADHYFRVIADGRARQEEHRQRGPNDRWQEGDGDEDEDTYGETDSSGSQDRRDRQDRVERYERNDRPERNDRADRNDRPERGDRLDRPERNERRDNRRDREDPRAEQGELASEGDPIESSGEGENPFVRDTRTQPREPRPRGRPRRDRTERDDSAGSQGLDPASLPPAFGARAESPDEARVEVEAEAPAPKRRGRPRKVTPSPEATESVEG